MSTCLSGPVDQRDGEKNVSIQQKEEFFLSFYIFHSSRDAEAFTVPAEMWWKPASAHQIRLRQAKQPGREGSPKPRSKPTSTRMHAAQSPSQ